MLFAWEIKKSFWRSNIPTILVGQALFISWLTGAIMSLLYPRLFIIDKAKTVKKPDNIYLLF